MKAVEFPQVNIRIAENQPEYETLPACVIDEPEGRIITCFELTDEEIEEIVQTRKLWHVQLAFKQPMQPIQLSTQNPFEETKPYEGLRIFELQHPDDEKEWIAAKSILEALQFYCSETSTDLIELDDYDIIELPQCKWDEHNISTPDLVDPEDEDSEHITIPFSELIKGMTKPDIIAGTLYD